MSEPPPSKPPRQNRLLGIGLRLGAMTSFGVMAAMIKLGYEAGASVVELVFYRLALGLVPLFVWIAWSRNYGAWRTTRPLAHLLRTALGLATMTVSFTALHYLPLAEATTISFAAPLFSVALSALILKEPVGRHRWSAVAAGLAGVLIVMQPAGEELPTVGLALAVVGALGVAFVTITIRTIGRTDTTQTTVLWFTGLAALAIGSVMPWHAQAHDPATWAILIALGLFGGVGQLLLTASLRFAPVAAVAPFDYLQLLWAVLFGWLIWQVQPPASTWAGAAVIIASGLYTLYREHRLGREKARVAPPL
ncbi:MAG TPA: DMT family transporter [Allosphingosinicella sp.]|jgi:drug/metabolite transporter (DMT)-like permease